MNEIRRSLKYNTKTIEYTTSKPLLATALIMGILSFVICHWIYIDALTQYVSHVARQAQKLINELTDLFAGGEITKEDIEEMVPRYRIHTD